MWCFIWHFFDFPAHRKMIKAVILIGGPVKGTRFRPLSLELPKPLFPVAGFPLIHHHIEACKKISDLKEVILIGFYQSSERLSKYIAQAQQEFKIPIRYLQEFQPLGTAGGLYHFRDQISLGNPEAFVVINADISCDFPIQECLEFHRKHEGEHTIMATEANKKQARNFGCLVENEETHEVTHYVEKPETFVSGIINCGLYIFSPSIFKHMGEILLRNYEQASDEPFYNGAEVIRMGEDVLANLAGSGNMFVFKTRKFWTAIKSAASAIYANRYHLEMYHDSHPRRLAKNGKGKPSITGDVYIHPDATVDPSAVLGPNVSVASGVKIGPGARIRESIILDGAELKEHCCILYSIIGWNCTIGAWARVEGTRSDPNPNDQFAKLESESLFNEDGKLTPSITVLVKVIFRLGKGEQKHMIKIVIKFPNQATLLTLAWCIPRSLGEAEVRDPVKDRSESFCRNVTIPPEIIVLNSIVLPFKDLSSSYKNEIIL